MEIEYELTEADVIAAAEYRLEHEPALRRRTRRNRLVYLCAFGLMGLGLLPLTPYRVASLALLCVGVLAFLLHPFLLRWRLRRDVARKWRGEKGAAALRRRTLHAGPEGLDEVSFLGEARVRWSAVDTIAVTPNHAYIYGQQILLGFIPRAAVSRGDFDEFVAACQRYVAEARASQA